MNKLKPRRPGAPTKRTPGRPTVRTVEVAGRVCEAVGRGVPYTFACRLAGISYSVFCEWRNSDATFREQLEEAVAVSVEARLLTIRDAAATDWRAASWWLEHVLPESFARNRIELTGPDGSPLAGAIALYLPQKQDGNGGQLPAVAPVRVIEDAD